MDFKLILLSRARNEIEDALDWYENRQEGLGEKLLLEVEDELQRIMNNPMLFPVSHVAKTHYRKAVLPKFPYVIIFSVSTDTIFVHSIFHTHLNPNKKPSA
jgi:plasmid stabilization system protein ParE